MQRDHGIYRNAVRRLDSSVTQPYNFVDELLLLKREDFLVETSFQSKYSEGVLPLHCLAQQFFLCSQTQVRGKLMAYFFEFPRIAVDGSPGAGIFSKTFPDVPHEFRVLDGRQASSWTRNTCRLTENAGSPRAARRFRTIEILLHRSTNIPCLVVPEFEP